MSALPLTNIVVDRKAEQGFRRRALKAMPVEYMETLWGIIKGTTAYVYVFMPIEHQGSPEELDYEEQDLEHQEDEARAHGYVLLGTIHTHPNRSEANFSQADADDSCKREEILFGICAIDTSKKRRKIIIAYWPGVSELNVLYKSWKDYAYA